MFMPPNGEGELRIIIGSKGEVIIDATLDDTNAAAFALRMRDIEVDPDIPLVLDLSQFEVDGGVAVAIAVSSLRELRARAGRMVIRGASQILAHNLYRVGAFEGRRAIDLLDTRFDEPSSS